MKNVFLHGFTMKIKDRGRIGRGREKCRKGDGEGGGRGFNVHIEYIVSSAN